MRVSGGEEQKTIWMFAALLFVNTNLKNNPYFCGLQVNKASWKLSLRSHWERVKTETCFASGENQRKAHTLAVNNDQQHEPNSLCIARATVPPGDRLAELQRGKNVRERERERERESESVADVPERWVLKAPWKKDYGCLCWPSGPLPAAQVCKLLKAAELRVRSWIFFTLFTLHPRLDGWLCFVQGENPLRFCPHLHKAKIYP